MFGVKNQSLSYRRGWKQINRRSRWQTSNQYTTWSALYPLCFGECVAFSHQFTRGLFRGNENESIDKFVECLIERGFPSVADLMDEAKDQ